MNEDDKLKKQFDDMYKECRLVTAKLTDEGLNQLIETLEDEALDNRAHLLACQEEKRDRSK